MSKLQAMREQRATKVKAMRAMLSVAEAATRELSAEELTQYDDLMAEVTQLDASIARELSLEQLEANSSQALPAVAAGIRTQNAPPGPEASKEFENFGEFMHAVRYNPNDQRLASLHKDFEVQGEQRMDTGSAGGFAVPTQFRETLLAVEGQEAVIRPRATVIPAGTA